MNSLDRDGGLLNNSDYSIHNCWWRSKKNRKKLRICVPNSLLSAW